MFKGVTPRKMTKGGQATWPNSFLVPPKTPPPGRPETGHPKGDVVTDARQTRELALSMPIFSCLSFAARLVSFSESQLDAFLKIGISRPMRTSVPGVVLSQQLSSFDVFMF
jgi:hypothetical protein